MPFFPLQRLLHRGQILFNQDDVLRRKLIYSFMQRTHTSENPLIKAIVQRDKFEYSVVNREWTKALYKGHKYRSMTCIITLCSDIKKICYVMLYSIISKVS